MKHRRRREGLAQRQREFDSKYAKELGMKRPGSQQGAGPKREKQYSKGDSAKRSRAATQTRGAQ